MKRRVIFMFSGQGSHYYHMGEMLFNNNTFFRKVMFDLDDIAIELMGESIIQKIYNNNMKMMDSFDRLLYTHPAIFMVEYALAQLLQKKGVQPDGVIGMSLGEFASAVIAGILCVKDAMESIIIQAKYIEQLCPPGRMVAVLSSTDVFKDPAVYRNCKLVSINHRSHFVIAGENEKLKVVKRYLRDRGISIQELSVLYGFHSSAIQHIKQIYTDYLQNKNFQRPQIDFISCLAGRKVTQIDHTYFWNVIRKPIHFSDAIHSLEKKDQYMFLDVGPSGDMANFARQHIDQASHSNIFKIMTHFKREITNLEYIEKYYKGNEGRKVKAFIFPGQGSQKKGMGSGLFDKFRKLTALADDILGYSIKELCLKDPERLLGETQFTQPALYVVNSFHYLDKKNSMGHKPDFVAGHSLGEYNALFAAGAFDFETGLKLVKKRGELMSQISGGGMAAIIGMSVDRVYQLFQEYQLQSLEIANYNTPSQTVIAGPSGDIEKAKSTFEEAGGIYVMLRVSGAFHSSYMYDIKEEFSKYLHQFDFNDLEIPVISNANARPYSTSDIKSNLLEQVNNPVKWTESIQYLLSHDNIEIEEIGPGNVLSKLVKSIKKEAGPLIISDDDKLPARPISISNSFGFDQEESSIVDAEEELGLRSVKITASSLGSERFKKDYNIKYAYVTGAMYRGVASKELVVKMGKAGLMGYFGAGGLKKSEVEDAILYIQHELKDGQAYGINLLSTPDNPQKEQDLVDLLLKNNVRNVEAAAYISMSPQLVRYRAHGLTRGKNGQVLANNRVLAKVSRPEVAESFLSPAPDRVVQNLRRQNVITQQQAEMLKEVPMADDICAEADSGGHTDHGVAFVLLPGIMRLRDAMMKKYQYTKEVRVGAAGGIGTAEAAAAAFVLGAAFVLTGSVNQCTVEAGTSDEVKNLLNQMDIQDTESAPAGDMFEIGARIQVLRKGLFFPARANKLYDLYRRHQSLDEIDENTRMQIEDRYFGRSFESIYEEAKQNLRPEVIAKAERIPKSKMALVFRWYFNHTSQLALRGDSEQKVDYQIHTGPALGDFNRWVKGTELEHWKNRNVDLIAEKIMRDTADLLSDRYKSLVGTCKAGSVS